MYKIQVYGCKYHCWNLLPENRITRLISSNTFLHWLPAGETAAADVKLIAAGGSEHSHRLPVSQDIFNEYV